MKKVIFGTALASMALQHAHQTTSLQMRELQQTTLSDFM